MTDTHTPGHETDQEQAQKQPSDARIILGPLVKYAAMGFVIVSIIITTAVMLDRQFNTIDAEVAALQAQLDQSNNMAGSAAPDATEPAAMENAPDTVASTVSPTQPATVVANPAAPQTPANNTAPAEVYQAAIEAEEDTTSSEPVPSATPVAVPTHAPLVDTASTAGDGTSAPAVVPAGMRTDDVIFDRDVEDLIAERNAHLNERDRIYLEEFRASQQKQLQLMRERLARQEQRIREMEQRYQEVYDTRAADMLERQEQREHFFADRI